MSLNVAAGVCVDPVGVSSRENGDVLVGCEGLIVDHRTEVRRLGVSHDPPLITIGGKARAEKSSIPIASGPAISVTPLTGRPTAARATAVATSSAAIGRNNACGNLTTSPSVAESAKPTRIRRTELRARSNRAGPNA